MVRWSLRTLDQLNSTGFGRPPPRHGLQLLFWFANSCVTFDPDSPADVMMLVLDCQPQKNVYGFHRFGNIEELLPVLSKPRKEKSKKPKLAYFVVGNLSTWTYPKSAELPAFVREYHGTDPSSNVDRIIISYQVKTQLVERVYITEHDDVDLGGFRSDGTHEISPELIRVLQDPQLDLSTFLTSMGYYGDVEMLQETEDLEDLEVSNESVQMIFDTMRNNPCWFFSDASRHRTDLTFDPSGWVQQDSFSSNSSVGPVVQFSKAKQKNKKSKTKKRQKVLKETYRDPRWELLYRAVEEEESTNKKTSGGDFSLWKILLGVGAIYLAAKCFGCLTKSCLTKRSCDKDNLRMFPRIFSWRTPRSPQTHVMLDYVF